MTHRGEVTSLDDESPRAEINMAKIPVSGDFPGLIFAAGTALIFYWGVPAVRAMLPAAIVLGCGIAVVLRFVHHEDQTGARIFRDAKSEL